MEDNPYGMLRYEGEPRRAALQARRRRLRPLRGDVLEDPLPGIRVGWILAPPPVMEKIVLGKQATDLCTSTLAQYFVAEFFAENRWREYIESLVGLYRRAARRHARLARAPLPRRGALDAARRRPLRLGDAAGLHRHLGPPGAGASRATSRSSPAPRRSSTGGGGAPCASTSRAAPRRRSARASAASAASSTSRSSLFGTFTGQTSTASSASGARAGAAERRTRTAMAPCSVPAELRVKVAVLKGGRSLERQVSMRSGARVEDALDRLGHEVLPVDAGADLVRASRTSAPTSRSSRCTAPTARTERCRSSSRSSASPTPARESPPAGGRWTSPPPSRSSAPPGSRRPDWISLQPKRLLGAGRRRRPRGDRGDPRLPAGHQAGSRRLLARRPLRRRRATTSPRRSSRRSATTTR